MRPILEAVIFRMLLHKAGDRVFSYFGKHEGGPPTTLWIAILLWPPEQKMNSPRHWKTNFLSLQMKSFQINDSKEKTSIENIQ